MAACDHHAAVGLKVVDTEVQGRRRSNAHIEQLRAAALQAAMGPLYALYREPGRHVVGLLAES